MIKVGTIVYVKDQKTCGKVVAIRIDSLGQPLIDICLDGGKDWLARFQEVSLA